MNMIKSKSILAFSLTLMMSVAGLTGCSSSRTNAPVSTGTELASGGVLHLSVNPEIAVAYDKDGNVTRVEGRNDDGSKLLNDYSGYEGKACRQVVAELVTAIGEAGYFVEEIEGQKRQITIEIESGSKLPHNEFLDEVVSEVRYCVNSNNWHSPVDVKGESDYGITDYADTDYGPNNDGVTDYNDGNSSYDDGSSNYGGNSSYDDGNSGYDDGGSNYDGGSDYDD